MLSTEQIRKPKIRITFYIPVDAAKRVKIAAILAGEDQSAFIARAALRLAEEIEQQEAEKQRGRERIGKEQKR